MSAKLEASVERGIQAHSLLSSPIVMEAFQALQDKYMETWKNTVGAESEAREKLWLACKIVDDVRNHLTFAVRDGKIAQQDIERMSGLNRAA